MIRLLAYVCACLLAQGVQALTLADCTRTTHISHGGEADHVDLGEGRVMWRAWWSQEGTATDFVIVDCGPGDSLRFRTAEERMNDRNAFDRTEKALRVVADHEAGARVFATLDRIAQTLHGMARDIQITQLSAETCACAAAYPALRGAKNIFKMDG
ncbi:MAG: hypothetical protein AB3N13_10865 [Arenibacterium sp.]